MFDITSRYFELDNAMKTNNDGRVVLYKKRRFIPPAQDMFTLQEMTIVAGERLDSMSARILGDPLQYWHICDANETMHPLELTEKIGKVVRIPLLGRG